MCDHLTTIAPPGSTQSEIDAAANRAANGIGQCIGFLELVKAYVPWNGEKCGLYKAARQMAPREKWISARIAANAAAGSNTNAAPGLPEGSPVNELGRLATSPCAHQK